MKLLDQKVDGVQTEVKDVARIEELTSAHLLKLEDKVADVITKQGKMENQISAVDGKVEKVGRDVHFGWTYIGEGIYKTYGADHYYKEGATLGECIKYCQQFRESTGREWNGLIFKTTTGTCGCQKNSHGINTEGWSEWVLYRVA